LVGSTRFRLRIIITFRFRTRGDLDGVLLVPHVVVGPQHVHLLRVAFVDGRDPQADVVPSVTHVLHGLSFDPSGLVVLILLDPLAPDVPLDVGFGIGLHDHSDQPRLSHRVPELVEFSLRQRRV
jgi:hypothetical protein